MSSIAAAALTAFTPALADETIKYTYDARGRLVKIAHSGTVNNGTTACYSYDKADNRSNVNVATSSECTTSGGGTAPSFAINNASATEGGAVSFTVSRSGSTSGSYTLDYATANGSAAAGSDYYSKSGTLTFGDGITSQAISVSTIQDTTDENNETFYVNLSNASGGATISDNQGIGTINDDDTSTGTCDGVSFSSNDASATEGYTLVFTISKSGTTSGSCSVSYATEDAGAIAGNDYYATSGTLTFASSETSKTVSVTTIDDALYEDTESMVLRLSNPTEGSTVSRHGTGSISDNDSSGGGGGGCCDLQSTDPSTTDSEPSG